MRRVEWVGLSKRDFEEFPDPVQGDMGYALYLAQIGGKHMDAKPLVGFGGASVVEVVSRHDEDAYRGLHGEVRGGDRRSPLLPEEVTLWHLDSEDRNRSRAA